MGPRSPLPRKARKRKARVVIDTRVLIAGISGLREPFVSGRNPNADTLAQWTERRNFVRLLTENILEEYKDVLKRLHVRPNLVGSLINLIRGRSDEIQVRASVQLSPDPKADPFCLCAEQGKADYIVTLNPKDFLQPCLKAKAVSPERFAG